MVKKIMVALAALLALTLGVASMQPDTYHVERSLVVAASPEVVFPYVNDFKKFREWNPWDRLDPNIVITYEGPESGVGHSYTWAGNKDVGKGKMTFTESVPNERTVADLNFIEPFESNAVTTWTLTAEGEGTKVTWGMDGTNNLMSKVMSLTMNMDQMIGADFEKGLGFLKEVTEVEAKRRADEAAAAAAAAEAAAAAAAMPTEGGAPAEGAAPPSAP